MSNILPFNRRPTQLSEVKKNIRVAGFEQQNLISYEALKQAINVLPDEHLKGLQVIKYDPTRSIQKLRAYYNGGFTGMPSAEYLMNYDSVVVYQFRDAAEFKHILYHEIGHFVFYKVLSSFDKKHWVTKLYPKSQHVTDYASRNASEDFAESYAVFLSDPDKLLRIGSKYQFLKTKVFKS